MIVCNNLIIKILAIFVIIYQQMIENEFDLCYEC